ncbi:hypothetical protein GCM10011514_36510 [Emticicia aquatilis]|uniref:Thioredoxin domain-containing protein n=2 Tax=Emticicia aquatilis TaxID=1537369 RepID=A0A916YZV2_9BACT|nr:hypothetical protein GCM10011514_36510 [Emticicia aquatilis]
MIKAQIILLESNSPMKSKPFSIDLTQEENIWKGSIILEKDKLGILITLLDPSSNEMDNNDKNGYSVLAYDTNDLPVKGAYVGLAIAKNIGYYNSSFDLKNDYSEQIELYEKDFARFTDLKEVVWIPYYWTIIERKKDGDKELIEKGLDSRLEGSQALSETEMSSIIYLYRRIGKKDKAIPIVKTLIEKSPKGDFAQFEKYSSIMQERDAEKRMLLFEDFEKNMSESPLLPELGFSLIHAYVDTKEINKLKSGIKKYLDPAPSPIESKADTYNSIAWKMAEASWELGTAKEFSDKAIELQILENQQNNNKRTSAALHSYYDTNGYILDKLGKKQEAYEAFKKAIPAEIENTQFEVNERFILSAYQTKHLEEAQRMGELFMKEAKSTEKIKEILKEIYIKKHGKKGLSNYVSSLETIMKAKQNKDIMATMFEEDAAPFELKDLMGNMVSLASLKDKIIIVDFWATWCGPCLASMPGMQEVQRKYKDNPKVKFLFIDTLEDDEDYLSKVKKLISDKKYDDLTVLLDVDSKLVAKYKVEGIPTKFVIDSNGKVRFKSVGYSGNKENLVNELSLMIDTLLSQR